MRVVSLDQIILRRQRDARGGFRTHHEGEEILFLAQRLGDLVQLIDRNTGDDGFHEGIFRFNAGHTILIGEMLDAFFGEVGGFCLIAVIVGTFVVRQQVLLGSVQFRRREAMAFHPFDLAVDGLHALAHIVGTGGGRHPEGAVVPGQAAEIREGVNEGRLFALAQFAETCIEHGSVEVADDLLLVGSKGRKRRFWPGGELNGEVVTGGLLVGHDHRLALRIGRNFSVGTRTRIGRVLKAREMLFHHRQSLLLRDVSHHHYGHQIRPVPVAVEAADGVRLEIPDDAVLADGESFGISGAFEKLGINLLEHSLLPTFSGATLFEDDGAFAVDVFIEVGDQVGPVFQHLEALFDIAGLAGGDGEDVHRFIETRVGVEVVAEAHADVLQEGYDLVLLEVFGAVEGHVFGHVGEALLVVVFHDRPDLHDEPELHFLFGFLVFADVIGQSVVQLALQDLRVHGQPFVGSLLREDRQQGDGENKNGQEAHCSHDRFLNAAKVSANPQRS